MDDEINKQLLLTGIRTLLGIAGAGLATHGFVDSGTANEIVGGVMAIIAAGWALWASRHKVLKSDAAQVTALNAGIAKSNESPGVTPPVAPEDAKNVIEQYAPPAEPKP